MQDLFPSNLRYVNQGHVPASSDAREYVQLIIENKWRILLASIFSILIAGAFLFVKSPVYSTDALLKVEKENDLLGSILESKQQQYTETSLSKEEVQVLRSRAVIGRVVDSLNLTVYAEPRYVPLVGKSIARSEFLQEILRPYLEGQGYALGTESIAVGELDVPESWLGKKIIVTMIGPSRYSLSFDDRLLVESSTVGESVIITTEGSDVLSLVVTELKGVAGTQFVLIKDSRLSIINDISSALSVEIKDPKSRVIGLSVKGEKPENIAAILNELVLTYQELRKAWGSTEAKTKLRFLEEQLPIVKADLESSEKQLADFRRNNNTVNLSAEATTLVSREAGYKAKLASLQESRIELRRRFKSKHPKVISIDRQIAAIKRLNSGLQLTAKKIPETEQELFSLQRNVDVNKKLYASLLDSAQKMRVVEAGSIGSVRIIDSAMIPEDSVSPKPKVIFLLATISGTLFYIIALFMRKGFRTIIDDSGAVEQQFGIPVYADIPHSIKQKSLGQGRLLSGGRRGSGVLALSHPNDITVESLRSLRTIVSQVVQNARNNVIMICGPRPAMGKSFVSVNLGVLLAKAGNDVLLVDGDLKRGKLHQVLDVSQRPGLAEMALGLIKTEKIIQPTNIIGMDVLTRGAEIGNSAEVLSSKRLELIIKQISQQYDYVIVDAPPVLDVADAAIIGRMAGANILVMKSGVVTSKEVQLSIKKLEQSGIEVDGCLINDVSPKKYGYYGYVTNPYTVEDG